MKTAIFTAALGLALVPLAAPSSAEAKGCLKGALVGGVAGHYAGHHGVLGAIGGCAVGRTWPTKRTRKVRIIRVHPIKRRIPQTSRTEIEAAMRPYCSLALSNWSAKSEDRALVRFKAIINPRRSTPWRPA